MSDHDDEPTEQDYQEINESPVEANHDFANVVVIDNVPAVDVERFDKLQQVIRKIFLESGPIADGGLILPLENGKTCGYAFIEYVDAADAQRAVAEVNGKRLDKNHTLRVSTYPEFLKLVNMSEVYAPPAKSEFDARDNLKAWLLDDAHRDQYVVRFGNETHIYWNDPARAANDGGRVLAYGGEKQKVGGKHWTDLYVEWSPRGSYLATYHQQGMVLWGGGGDNQGECSFNKLQRFQHPGVKLIAFSPCETYMVTCNGQEKKTEDDAECIIVWDCKTGQKKRGFDGGSVRQWPAFQWSHDDKYMCRIGKDTISCYSTPSMGLLDKKSLKIPGVKQCEWSPSENILSYWTPEVANTPAAVTLISMPSREVLREKHMFNVVDIKLHWHDQGTYLAVKLARLKSKKQVINNFEIFRVGAKGVPVDVVEVTDSVSAFAWEPQGHRFAIIHSDNVLATRSKVSFYQLKSNKIKLLKTLDDRAANNLFFSPSGRYCVIGGLGALNGQLEWIDVNTGESMVHAEHFMCSDVEWDPSGRYVITAVSQPLDTDGGFSRRTMENGYRIWSFQGEQLAQNMMDCCYQVVWRPRPPLLLEKEEQRDVEKHLKDKYWNIFLSEDDKIKTAQLSGAAKERLERKEHWKKYRADAEKEYAAESAFRCELRGGLASDDESDWIDIEQLVEEELSRETVVVKDDTK